MRQFGAPAAAFGLAGHGRAALGAVFLHDKSMPRRMAKVKQSRTAGALVLRFRFSRIAAALGGLAYNGLFDERK
jgi:hypothetical protein